MTFCLSIHADYRCRHSGACCTAGWPIPVDEGLKRSIEAAAEERRLVLGDEHSGSALFVANPDGGWIARQGAGACVFYERKPRGLCEIHRQLGEAFLPSSCRHFPRVALLDPRGVSLTLSHYCPTAAALLFREDVPLEIVEHPPAFPPDAVYEGLDARSVLPPLLRPGLLWDLDGYSRWEREAVRLLARDDVTPESGLEALRVAAREIEKWQPGREALSEYVSAVFSRLPLPAHAESRWQSSARIVNRYLGARLFASWVPYRSNRLLSLVEDVARAHDVLSREAARKDLLEAIRAADLQIVHGR